MKFIEGELIEILKRGQREIYEIREGQEGEPRKHRYNTKTGKAQPYGSEVRITEKFRRLNKI
jgi:hypothetical protein